ncbi:MAG: zinc metallopeptidase [Clostridiales bacterium]|jgi:Zn-dependent membrane protease YugP|nr:zinc metallopeptidase [Clostridiales bacterium]
MLNYFYGGGIELLLFIPAIILAVYAQFKVSGTFKKFSGVGNRRGITGAQTAQMLLDAAGVRDVAIERIHGSMTDHYDPRDKVLRLSDTVYASASIAAVGVAAHETGHALQHSDGYSPLAIRNSIVPAVNFGSRLATPMIFIGLLLTYWGGEIGITLASIGVLLFAGIVLFQLITLPVEFNASSRAIELLEQNRVLSAEELDPAKKVLNAAALTYVAAAFMAIVNLLRMVLLVSRRRGD